MGLKPHASDAKIKSISVKESFSNRKINSINLDAVLAK